MLKILVLAVALLAASGARAQPASNSRVAGGMLLGVGIPIALIGMLGITERGPYGDMLRDGSSALAFTGLAATGLGTWLWIRGGPQPAVALTWRY